MPTMRGLPGTLKDVEAASVKTRSSAIQQLRQKTAITAAGDYGALIVWFDDDGLFRCEFMRHCKTVNASQFKYLAAVDEWLRKWFPLLNAVESESN